MVQGLDQDQDRALVTEQVPKAAEAEEDNSTPSNRRQIFSAAFFCLPFNPL